MYIHVYLYIYIYIYMWIWIYPPGPLQRVPPGCEAANQSNSCTATFLKIASSSSGLKVTLEKAVTRLMVGPRAIKSAATMNIKSHALKPPMEYK